MIHLLQGKCSGGGKKEKEKHVDEKGLRGSVET